MKIIFSLNLLIFGLLISTLSFKAQAQEFEIKDSTNTNRKISEIMNYQSIYDSRWITFGVKQDFVNSTFGAQISNGFDERPLKHFEDFQDNVVFKFSALTDFNKDYSLGVNLGWQYPIKHLNLVSSEFRQFDYSRNEFNFRDINFSAMTYFKNLGVTLKIGLQELNDYKNIGTTIELQRDILYNRLYTGLSIGYYSDYINYSAFFQGFIYRKNISLRLNYERIDSYDFLNLGLNFTFKR